MNLRIKKASNSIHKLKLMQKLKDECLIQAKKFIREGKLDKPLPRLNAHIEEQIEILLQKRNYLKRLTTKRG